MREWMTGVLEGGQKHSCVDGLGRDGLLWRVVIDWTGEELV